MPTAQRRYRLRAGQTPTDFVRKARNLESRPAANEVIGGARPPSGQPRVAPAHPVRAVVLEPDPIRRPEPLRVVGGHRREATAERARLDEEPSLERDVVL